ncbi:MAG: hypothetical protein GXZ09_00280 [Syntrophomonadaceae bacterium]|nr:hypothetical protein [Syntrophomonadaceae bacterium]
MYDEVKQMQFEISRSERIYAFLAILLGILILLGLVGQFIIISDEPPPQAVVYMDQSTGIYYAPPYILGKKYPPGLDESRLKAITIAEAKQMSYKADEDCVELGYFKQKSTLNDRLRIMAGLVEKPPSRWNEDGSWNW